MSVTASTPAGPVSAFVHQQLMKLLDKRRVVVWYDAERAFTAFAGSLRLDHCVIVSCEPSRLQARRSAEAVYRRLNDSDASPESGQNLLIYLPAARGATPEERMQDPFEVFARCGAAFGDQEGQRLQALAQLALPQRATAIAQLFHDGQPTLALLDNLRSGAQYPLVRQALGSDSPTDALAAAISRADAGDKVKATPGALAELQRLAQTAIGAKPRPAETWEAWRTRFATYLLASELAHDLPDGLPAALATIPHAPAAQREQFFAICDRLRETDAGREAYGPLAREVEASLRLATTLPAALALGARDTFPLQDQLRLRAISLAATTGDLATAHALFEQGAATLWRRDPERIALWKATEHSLAFLTRAASADAQHIPSGVKALVAAYAAPDGLWQLDQAQRRYEHSAVACNEHDEVEPLLQFCRARYAAVTRRAQTAFQSAVQKEGWPPEGVRRQTQTFDTAVAPELSARGKLAYFLVDSLRYEMGRELAAALAAFGAVTISEAATILPTKTPFGMAALMPGADGAFILVEQRSSLAPAIGGAVLPGAAERIALLATKYGDRHLDLMLEDVLGVSSKALKKRTAQADLLVIRTLDIDDAGEGRSLYRARDVMSRVIRELYDAARRLVDCGVETLVFAADHGHVLLPELPAGDTLSQPPGEWLLTTRRALLGRAQAQPPGMLYLAAAHVGIIGPIEDYVAAKDFKTFKAGESYFHEGLSLQECIIPVVSVRVSSQQAPIDQGAAQIALTYRSNQFTSSVIGLKIRLTSLFPPTLSIKLAAYESADPGAGQVGSVGECDALNLSTGELELRSGQEIQAPLSIDPNYQGDRIEVRAIDPQTGAILARLTLKNARLD